MEIFLSRMPLRNLHKLVSLNPSLLTLLSFRSISPPLYKAPIGRHFSFNHSLMPSAISRRQMSPEFKIGYMPDLSPSLLNFDDPHRFMPSDDQLLFDMEDVSFTHDASSGPFSWDLKNDTDSDIKPAYYTAGPSPLSSNYDYLSQASPTDSFYDPSAYLTHEDSTSFDNNLFGSWIHEPELIPIPSPVAPIPISPNDPQNLEPFFTFGERSHFPQDHGLSPSEFAALQPLPMSPSSSYEESHAFPRQRVDSMTSISPADISAVQTPEWVSLFDNTATPSSISIRTPASSRPSVRHSPISSDGVQRIRMPRRASITSSQLFQSASAPSHSHLQSQSRSASSMASRRAESVSLSDDRDATVRRRRKVSNTSVEEHEKSDKPNDSGMSDRSQCRRRQTNCFCSTTNFIQSLLNLLCVLQSWRHRHGSCILPTGYNDNKLPIRASSTWPKQPRKPVKSTLP